jgi:fermentation-respiration switch protein FrsA (DUF1100 family)
MGNGAVVDLLGGPPSAVPDRYAAASPVRLLPTGVPVLCVHGTADDAVAPEQSERYAAAARDAGDDVQVRVVPDDHMALIDPAGPSWALVVDWLAARR